MANTVRLIGACVVWVASVLTAIAAEHRFVGQMVDGVAIQGTEVTEWHKPEAKPKLGDTRLFDPARPIRWLRDESLPPAGTPGSYIDFWFGDRLPGRVVRWTAARNGPYEIIPAHLQVDPSESVSALDLQHPINMLVNVRWVKRIVWEGPAKAEYVPGTVYQRDGRQVKFRSLRWTTAGVRLLLDEGTTDVDFSQMAELHLPRIDPWPAWFEQMAQLCTDAEARAVRLECIDGLRATTSTSRIRVLGHDGGQPDHWAHAVQPVWSLAPLWLRYRAIQSWRFSSPWEIPVGDCEPVRVVRKPQLSRGWTWQVDRNVEGKPLGAAGRPQVWGLSTPAFCELEYELPDLAAKLRGEVALDEAAGSGGCARAKVLLRDKSDQVLFASGHLIGQAPPQSFGPIDLPVNKSARWVLQADPAHHDRPAGADPLDIRDLVNWIEPELILDESAYRAAVTAHPQRLIPAWDGWTVEAEGGLRVYQSAQLWNGDQGYHVFVSARSGDLKLSKRLKVPAGAPWLHLNVATEIELKKLPQIRVLLNGQQVAEFLAPPRYYFVDPVTPPISLAEFAGEEVDVEILQSDPSLATEWRGISILPERPGRRALFDEEPDFAARFGDGEGQITVDEENAASGRLALRVTAGERIAFDLGGLPIEIRENPKFGQYRYLRFAWKKQGGSRVALTLGHDRQLGPADEKENKPDRSFRYDAGSGGPTFGVAKRVDAKFPARWVSRLVDLYADFGAFDLTALALACPDGEAAWFDQIVLFRTSEDAAIFDAEVAQRNQPK